MYAVSRLQEFLKLYQARYPELEITESSLQGLGMVDPSGNDEIPPWMSHSRYLSPLLVAYEARMKELETSNHACQVHT